MRPPYDAIVIGARCAGAPTAMLLARQGHRVLVVDRSTFPSDTLSTLVINPPGVAALARFGVLDEVVATGCPPIETYTFDFGPVVITGRPGAHDGIGVAYAPRRTVLDAILVEAARRAGAEVREGFTLEELVIEDGTVVGIRGRDGHGSPIVERARVVIGADGWNSMVARAVGAEQYHTKPVLQHAFYAYWRGLEFETMTTFVRDDRAISAIPTNDDLTLVLVGCPFAQTRAFRGDVEGNYAAALERVPHLAKQARAATREGRVVGGGVPNFFRKPFGLGWVLVGDAGYTKDPLTAQGISDAFRGAEACAGALGEVLEGRRGFDDALGAYQTERDAAALPIYEFTTQLATLEPPPPELQELLAAMQGKQAAMDAFVRVVAGTMSPIDFFDPAHLATITGTRQSF